MLERKKKWWDANEGEIIEFDWEIKVQKELNNMGKIPKGINGWVSLIDVENGNICVMKNRENSDGEGMFMLKLEEENRNMNWRWIHVGTPSGFSKVLFLSSSFSFSYVIGLI